jgi:hypothetical protein
MKIRAIIFLTFFLAVAAAYFLWFTEVPLVSDGTLYLVAPVAAALIALYVSRIYRFNSANGRAQLLIAAGLACWGIAEIITYVLNNIIPEANTFPSLANFFLLLAFPIFGAGIYQGYTTAGVKLKQVNRSLLFTVLSASIVLTILVAYFGVNLVYDPESDLLSNIVTVSTGLGDLVLIILSMLTILVASEYKGGKLASFWKTMASGFFLFLVADIMFAMHGNEYTEDMYEVVMELAWIGAYLLLAYGVLENYIHLSAVQKNIKAKLTQDK